MKVRIFDAAVILSRLDCEGSLEAGLIVQGRRYGAGFDFYPSRAQPKAGPFFARISAPLPFSLKWGDGFNVVSREAREILGQGTVLDPFSPEIKKSQLAKRVAFLNELTGEAKEMILALCRREGFKGLKEQDILDFCRLSRTQLDRISQELEAEGRVKILSFSPLLLLSQESLALLCDKIRDFFSLYHQKHPGERGLSLDRVQKRFDVPPKVLSLALRYLEREGAIKESGSLFFLSGFEIKLTPREEGLLEKMEGMYFRGEFQFVSLEEIQKEFKLRPSEGQKLLALLVERKKVVQGKDGFMLQAGWLEEVIRKIRALGRKELTVAEFKKMTGLTRKYAIPILELLDEMGVTRRQGPAREIL